MNAIVDGFNFTEDDYVEDILKKFEKALRVFGVSVYAEYNHDNGCGAINLCKTSYDDFVEQSDDFITVKITLSKENLGEFLTALGIKHIGIRK